MKKEETPTEKLLKETKTKQKPSATYTITQMGSIREKLKELELITDEELEKYEEIRKAVATRFYEKMIK